MIGISRPQGRETGVDGAQGVPKPIVAHQLGHLEKVDLDYAAGDRVALAKTKMADSQTRPPLQRNLALSTSK
jgi:hypothetical protein